MIGGSFTVATGGPADNVAAWNGATWSQLGGGTDGPVFALATLPGGDLVAGGGFHHAGGTVVDHLARWNGTSWSTMGGLDGDVLALAVLANGDLIVGGQFQVVGGVPAACIARWDGTAWSALGVGVDAPVRALLPWSDNGVVAGGAFLAAGGIFANHVARWNGSAWSTLGYGVNGWVDSMALLPNGDVVVGGRFQQAMAVAASGIARWGSVGWQAFGAGADQAVSAIATMPSGDLVLGGAFTVVDGAPSAHLATITTTCPAQAAIRGLGCQSGSGVATLEAATLPWVDATFRADGTSLPPIAIVLALTGFTSIPQGAVPLTAVFAQGGPGCDILATPDFVDLLLTTNGTAQSSVFVPSSSALVGSSFFHQMIPIELTTSGTVPRVVATNALELTVGRF